MGPPEMSKETADLNLAAMLQARKLLREDRAEAKLRLGLSDELAELLAGMSLADTIRLAASDFLRVSMGREGLRV